MKSSGIHIRAISQEMPQPPVTTISLKITWLTFHSNFPGANELMHTVTNQKAATSHYLNNDVPLYWHICVTRPQCINSWWWHDMETLSALLAPCDGNRPIDWWIPLTKGQWCWALMLALLIQPSCWRNSVVACDLICHVTLIWHHYNIRCPPTSFST